MDQGQWVNCSFLFIFLSQRKALSNRLRRKLDCLSSPAILRQEFIRVFPVCDPLLLPHRSLATNTQLLGYLSRAPIKGCHSGSQCPWANHIRAPAHALPPPLRFSLASLITFKYFRGRATRTMWEERKITFLHEQYQTRSYDQLVSQQWVTIIWGKFSLPCFGDCTFEHFKCGTFQLNRKWSLMIINHLFREAVFQDNTLKQTLLF